VAAAALCGAADVQAAPRPTVVELFTSEGCNSCPPAEAYLGELAQRGDVLALAYHVQYWDELGWQDRFGLSAAAQRQNAYVNTLRLSSAYTPQLVVDGRRDFLGSDRSAVGRALSTPSSATVPVQILLQDARAMVTVGAASGAVVSEVMLVAYRRSAVTAIGRGENSGRRLAEYNIVRAVQPLGRWVGRTAVFDTSLSQLPRDATDIAVLVQPQGQGPIMGAATAALPAAR
jgi:hypothetical protein